MQDCDKIYGLLFVVIISNIFILVLVTVLSNFTYAQYLHNNTLYEIAKHLTVKQNAYITAGKTPSAVDISEANKIYVANSNDNTISVIDGATNTRIGKDIPVGTDPSAIGINELTNKIYVANTIDNSVSVINGENDTKIGKDIPVGVSPSAIAVTENKIYVANSLDWSVSVIDGENDTKIGKKDIRVGISPSAIGVTANTIYVANRGSGTVSVIDGKNYTKIGDIPVGVSPSAIDVFQSQYGQFTIYVANSGDNTISVIDGSSNTVIGKPIPVGFSPSAISVTGSIHADKIYVANSRNNTISVIDGKNYTKIGDIPVGVSPSAMSFDGLTKTIYVANSGDNTISVIDGEANKVVAKVMFNIKPFNSGYVVCDNTTDNGKWNAPIQQQFYVYSGSGCTATPYPGFEFVSWEANLGKNSTQLVNATQSSVLDPILDFLHINFKPESKLSIMKFGNFTTIFKALPPPIPPEYVATLFGIVATAFVSSWLTPAIIGWRKTKTQRKYFKECENQIGKVDKNAIEEKIIGYYVDGKISQEHRQLLNDKISGYYEREKGS